MLYTKFVELTAGLVKPRTLIWKGRRMNAPDTPAMEVNDETANATSGGRNTHVATPDTGNSVYRASMEDEYNTIRGRGEDKNGRHGHRSCDMKQSSGRVILSKVKISV